MKLLLTGASGYIGSRLLHDFSEDFSVTTVSRKTLASHSQINVDLATDQISFEDQKFDLVVHCAGVAHISPMTRMWAQRMRDVNIKGTANLLQALTKNPPRAIVFLSSVAVYGRKFGLNFTENTSLEAKDPYGGSKLVAENHLLEWGKRYQVTVTILRLPLVVGPGAPGNLRLMEQAIKRNQFFLIGDGSARRSMVLLGDISRFIRIIWNIGGIYNLTDEKGATYKQLASIYVSSQGANSIKSIPKWLAYPLALAGELVKRIFGKSPFDISVYNKLTKSLTFRSMHYNTIEWKPARVLDHFEPA